MPKTPAKGAPAQTCTHFSLAFHKGKRVVGLINVLILFLDPSISLEKK